MNPAAFVNQQPANPYALPPPNGALNLASSATAPATNGAAAPPPSGESPAGAPNSDVKMEEVESSVGEGKEVEVEAEVGGPTKREQVQEEHDLDLAHLLDQMDQYKSIVSSITVNPHQSSPSWSRAQSNFGLGRTNRWPEAKATVQRSTTDTLA